MIATVAGTANRDCAVSHMLAAADRLLSNRRKKAQGAVLMNVVWIVVGIGIIAIVGVLAKRIARTDRKSTRLNSTH